VSGSESEDDFESPGSRGLFGLKRRLSGSLVSPSGSDADLVPKSARLTELDEGAGNPSDAHEHQPVGAVLAIPDTGAGLDGCSDSTGAAGTSLPLVRPTFEYISDGTFSNQTTSLYWLSFLPIDHSC
jgi:hypothetical protein